MNKFDIYCFTSRKYNLLDKFPKNIIPVGLGENNYPQNYLHEKNGENLSKYNKYFAEMSGIYWVFKNRLKKQNNFIN